MIWIKRSITIIILIGLVGLFGGTIPASIIKEFIYTTNSITDTVTIYKSVYELQENKKYKVPDVNTVKNMDIVANEIWLPIFERFPEVVANSFYRDWSWKSQHTLGMAIDLDSPNDNRAIYEYIRDSLDFDQLIIYRNVNHPSHIHCSFNPEGNRKDVKRAYRWKGRWYYRKIK